MPLVKRTVTPTHLCRQKLPHGLTNELECVTNNTLSGVINQLASLSSHAEDIFGELFSEANTFYGRASSLKDRIDNLSVKVTQLDSNVEEVSLIDINSRKAFKSSVTTDQQVVSRQSLPRSVHYTYQHADAPPPLQDLNQFRDDGKDGLKIYTDPDYFFDLWREAIQKETREAREKRREQRKKDKKANPDIRKQAKVRQAVNTRKMNAERLRHGAEFVEHAPKQANQGERRRSSTARRQTKEYHSPDHDNLPPQQSQPPPAQQQQYNNHMAPPPPPLQNDMASSFPEPPMDGFAPPPPEPMYPQDIPPPPPSVPPSVSHHSPGFSPPMAPPPPMMNGGHVPPPPPMQVAAPPPPPAPAPPPPPMLSSGESSTQSSLASALQNVSLKKSEPSAAPVVDERSNLLQAIRLGINLKKVEQKERSEAPPSSKNDVASILARRIAVEFSDSDESDSTLASEDDWED